MSDEDSREEVRAEISGQGIPEQFAGKELICFTETGLQRRLLRERIAEISQIATQAPFGALHILAGRLSQHRSELNKLESK